MKAALVVFCFTVTAFAQQQARFGEPQNQPPAACGPARTSFKVKLQNSRHGPQPLQPGMAQIYFIHEAGIPFENLTVAYPTTKYGMDGAWAGAGHGNSWFAVPIAPGKHHLCATLQSSLVSQRVELLHFTAQAGMSYYFRTRLVLSGSVELLVFNPLDSDQGTLLVSTFPMAAAAPKK